MCVSTNETREAAKKLVAIVSCNLAAVAHKIQLSHYSLRTCLMFSLPSLVIQMDAHNFRRENFAVVSMSNAMKI